MKKLVLHSIVSVFIFSSSVSFGHGRWIIPSDTILSSQNPTTISLDFSVSNDVFHPDHAYGGAALASLFESNVSIDNVSNENKEINTKNKPKAQSSSMDKIMGSTRLQSVFPSGKIQSDASIVNLGRKSVSALTLSESGTYRISVQQDPIYFVTFHQADGSKGRIFGELDSVDLPKGAKDIHPVKLINRVQTFVTRNQLTHENIKPLKDGLDIGFSSHPNELFSKETNSITITFNGEPLAKCDIKVTRGGTRYRNSRDSITGVTDKHGRIDVKWPQAGMYVLEVEHSVASKEKENSKGITTKYGLFTTLEVNPE